MRSATVELYMHGHPDQPTTAYSMLACRVLAVFGIHYTAYDITTDLPARHRAQALSGIGIWPQLVVNGEFVGGSEVLIELLRTGQLASPDRPAVAS